MKKVFVTLSAVAMLALAAVPASAQSTLSPANNAANHQVTASYTLPTGWISHSIYKWDRSGADRLDFNGGHGKHSFYIKAEGDISNVEYIVQHGGNRPIEGKLSTSQYVTIEGDTATVYFYNKTDGTKNFRVKYEH
ncbi:hypothetical protein [Brevibacillus borstelensis]|uniref:hypothetical protein n=1 Tax=Brevibacillus borstelensis TaxID=45462 RepID=UPI0030BEBC5B